MELAGLIVQLPDDLAAAIEENPDQPEVRLVAADWLQHRGDPQGELIALAIDGSPEHATRIAVLQRELDPIDRKTSNGWHLGWRWGFVQQISHWPTIDRDAEKLVELLRSPLARFASAITLDGIGEATLPGFLAALAEVPRTLRCLSLRHSDPFGTTDVDLTRVWPRIARLEHLTLHIPHVVGPLVLPALVELSLLATTPEALHALETAVVPAVRTLRLIVPDSIPVASQVSPERFPALRHLAIMAPFEAPDLARVAAFPITAQLDMLETVNTSNIERDTRRFPIARGPASTQRGGLLDLGRAPSSVAGRFTLIDPTRQFRVGRTPDCDLRVADVLPGRSVAIDWVGAGWWVREVQAPTRLNGLVLPHVELQTGDELQIGLNMFRFVTGDLESQLAEVRARFALPSLA